MYRQGFWKAALGMAVSAMLAGPAMAEEWRFAIEEIPGSIMDSYAQEFKKRIEEATDGEVTVTIYPLGSLGTPTEVAEQTADGILQFSNVSIGNIGTLVPESQILLVPYLFPGDTSEVNRRLQSSETLNTDLQQRFESKGLRIGSLYSEGPMVWTTKKPVHSPEDLRNFKMRVMVSPLLLKAYEDLGASPTPVPFGEVYGALQLGQIDGQVNPLPAIEEMKFYEVSNYLIWAGESDLITVVLMSADWFETQSAERQQLVEDTMRGVNEFMGDVISRFNDERLEKIMAAKPDITQIRLSEDERATFRERAEATKAAVGEVVSPDAAGLLEKLQAEISEQ